jgi:hypothetical protein
VVTHESFVISASEESKSNGNVARFGRVSLRVARAFREASPPMHRARSPFGGNETRLRRVPIPGPLFSGRFVSVFPESEPTAASAAAALGLRASRWRDSRGFGSGNRVRRRVFDGRTTRGRIRRRDSDEASAAPSFGRASLAPRHRSVFHRPRTATARGPGVRTAPLRARFGLLLRNRDGDVSFGTRVQTAALEC